MADFSDIGIRVLILGVGEARRSLGMVRGDMNALERDIRKLSTTSINLGQNLTRLGSQMVGLGRTLTLALTTPLLLLGGGLVQSGIKFEDTFAGVTKTVDGISIGFKELVTETQQYQEFLSRFQIARGPLFNEDDAYNAFLGFMKESEKEMIFASDRFGTLTEDGLALRDGIRQLSLELPLTTTELNAVAQAAGQLGIPLGDSGEVLLEFTEIMAMLGMATDLTAQDAAIAFARMANIYGISADDMVEWSNKTGAALVRLGNTTASTEPEILNLAMRMASAGKLAGMSIPELLGLSATIAEVGVASERGGTAVSRMLTELMMAPTSAENLGIFTSVLDMSAAEFEKALEDDTFALFDQFIVKFNDKLAKGMITQDMLTAMGLGGVRVQDVMRLLGLAHENLATNVSEANAEWEHEIALQEEVQKRMKTVATQIRLMKNAFADIGVVIFDLYRDKIEGFVNGLKNVANTFRDLDPRFQRAIVSFGLIAAAIGPVMTMLGLFLQNVGIVITALTSLPVAIGKFGLALATLPLTSGPALLGLGALALAAAALYRAFDTNFLGIRDLIDRLKGSFEAFGIAQFLNQAIEDIKAGDWNSAFEHIEIAWGNFMTWARLIALPQITAWGKKAVVDLSAAIVTEAQNFPGYIAEAKAVITDAFTDLFSIEVDPDTGEAEDVLGLKQRLSQFKTEFDSFKSWLDTVIQPISDGLGDLWEGIEQFVNNVSEAKIDNIAKFLVMLAGGLIQLGAAFIGDALSLAGEILPSIGSGIASVVNAVNDLKPESLALITGYLTFLAGVKLGLIAAGMIKLAAAQLALALSTGALASPLILIIGLIGALILLGVLALETDLFGLGPAITKVLNAIVNLPGDISAALEGLPTQLKRELSDPFSAETYAIIRTLPRINTGLEELVAGIPGALIGLGESLDTHLVTPFLNAVQPVVDILDSIISKIASIVGSSLSIKPDSGPDAQPEWKVEAEAGPSGKFIPRRDFVTSAWQQTRDIGGRVRAGNPYMVGIRAQPELFVPSENGMMYPLKQWMEELTSTVYGSATMSGGDRLYNQLSRTSALTSRLLQTVSTQRVVNRNTSVYSPHFYGTPARETVDTNLSLYDKWLMSTQGA